MGADFKLVLYAAEQRTANLAAAAAYARVAELDKKLSDYDPASELTRLSVTAGTGKAVPLGEDLWFVLERSQKLAAATEGAFDATVGPLVKAWRSARRTKTFPSAERLAKARASVGFRNLRLDPQARTAELLVPGMLLDLGGIAMGYTADEALRVIRSHGITRAMIDASGDILCGDPPPGKRAWTIGIAPLTESKGPPSRYVELVNAALTTSGDAFQFVELDGRRYSHIVDPHTGLGLTTRSSVTITARDCITADSLATAVSVLGPERGLQLVEKTAGAEAFIVREESGMTVTTQSKGFRSTATSPPSAAGR
ncbi:MAG: FAD:protein FMN transferase [Planctomycetia bacterium]|nr:FAD:protein FMN transferase [Planctomycetia bacterium]